jgi:hypothetical protein
MLLARCCVIVIASLMLSIAFGEFPSVAEADSQGAWCGDDATKDWVCPTQGAVFASKHLLRQAVAVPINDRVLATAQESSAHLAFGELANCTLEEASKIAPWGEHANSLFTEYRGDASCVSSGLSRVAIDCNRAQRCPAEMRADGTFLFKGFPPSGATASVTTIRRQRIMMESCSGFIEARVLTPDGVEEANGTGSPGVYVIIEIVVTSRVVEKSWGTSVEEFAKVKSEAESRTPGECASSAVQEEEEVVRP